MKKLLLLTLIMMSGITVIALSSFLLLLNAGKSEVERRTKQVNIMVNSFPDYFVGIYTDIFPSALSCQLTTEECRELTRKKFETLPIQPTSTIVFRLQETERGHDGFNFFPNNNQPMYFIQLLPDGNIAKLFFSGDLKIEKVDTREERMVVELLEGKRRNLYGPYFDSEVFITGWDPKRDWYDPKPAYLKDLYAQLEVIVPYNHDSSIAGGIVYLHGE